jgi:hypothetical protein
VSPLGTTDYFGLFLVLGHFLAAYKELFGVFNVRGLRLGCLVFFLHAFLARPRFRWLTAWEFLHNTARLLHMRACMLHAVGLLFFCFVSRRKIIWLSGGLLKLSLKQLKTRMGLGQVYTSHHEQKVWDHSVQNKTTLVFH